MKTSKKAILLQGIIVFGLFIIVAVSLTTAWFTAQTQNNIQETTIDVSSANVFDLSLDGVNYGRDLRLKFYDNLYGNKLNTLLKDLSPVITSSVEIGGGTSERLDLYVPKKDDYTGEPLLDKEWTPATKTIFLYDEETNAYYVVNSNEHQANYIEFDLWVRSDSQLDIYLGSESYVSAVEEGTDSNKIYAMYANEYHYNKLIETLYYSLTEGNKEIPYAKVINVGDDNTRNPKYVYKYNQTTTKYEFLAYRVVEPIEPGSSTLTSNFYNINDEIITNEQDPSRKLADEIINNDHDYLYHINSQEEKTIKYFYNSKGEVVGLSVTKEGNKLNYTSEDNYLKATPTSKNIQVLTQSPYNYVRNIKNEDVVSCTVKNTFSKNLAVGAMRVAFSELDMNDDSKEHLKYIWNPNPLYELTTYTNGAEFKIMDSLDEVEDTYYYTYDSATKKYVVHSVNESLTGLIHNGDVLTTMNNIGGSEIPICSTEKTNSSDEFSIKKMRVKIYLDGTDQESQNPLLSSSESGNGQVHINLQFVSYYDSVLVDDVTSYVSEPGLHEYYFSAYRNSELKDNVVEYSNPSFLYNWSVNNTDKASITTTTVNIDGVDVKCAKVTANEPGMIVVYAESDNRVGTITIVINDIIISYTRGTGDYDNLYTLSATENGMEAIGVTYSIISGNCAFYEGNNNMITCYSYGFIRIKAVTETGIGVITIGHSIR